MTYIHHLLTSITYMELQVQLLMSITQLSASHIDSQKHIINAQHDGG